jgi:hypothetical protein
MSDLTYFQSPFINLGNSLVDGGKTLVKRAIIAIEGCHTCNKGKKYEFPAERIQAMADNTNAEIANGRIISMFRNHQKSAESHFGDLTGLVECRRVTADDLADPTATGMIGKLAIFANANIIKHLDLVKSRSIKALSPGIDTARNIIFEVSAVPVASMPGVALFSYAEVKAQRSKYLELRDRAIESLDTLIESFRQMERTESETQTGGNLSQQQDSFNDFIADLRLIFEVPRSEDDSTEGIVYSQNPYDREVIRGAGFGYALDQQEREDVLDEVANILKDTPSVKKFNRRSNRSKGGDFATSKK